MPSPESPKVSVVIPVYNRERYLAEAIDSVLAQTLTDFELLVVDDGSSDRSLEVAESYRDPRIRVVRHERNRGMSAARNTGIAEARGRYLAFLDSDDMAYPNRLALQAAFLDRHPDIAAVGAWIDWMDASGHPLGRVKRKAVAWDDIAAQSLFRPGIQDAAAMARTDILRRFPHDERYRIGADFDLWVRIAAAHKLANLPRVLVRCREHEQRTTHNTADESRALRLTIFRAQLDALGIGYTPEDLERHYLLRRMRKMRVRPDPAYLDWAETWLRTLREANQRVRLYPEPAFSHVLGSFWARVCGQARWGMGVRAASRFLSSPMRRWAWAGIRKDLSLVAPRPFAAGWRSAP